MGKLFSVHFWSLSKNRPDMILVTASSAEGAENAVRLLDDCQFVLGSEEMGSNG